MTIPIERLRAIGWGRELLFTMRFDVTLPSHLRIEALALEDNYPTKAELLALVTAGPGAFPKAWGASIEGARSLFQKVHLGDLSSQTTRRDAYYTLRHFPEAGWSKTAEAATALGQLGEWIERDAERDA
jgi:hypothetical protein